MLLTLIKKEMLEHILSIRFYISLILAFIFLIPAVYILSTEYGELAREMNPYISKEFYTWGYSWYWLNRKIPVLKVLCSGLGDHLSLSCANNAYTGPIFTSTYFIQNPLRTLFFDLDFLFFINIVGSLLAFAFTYDAISGERESGTLRLIFVNSVSRPMFLLGKWISSLLSFVISCVPAFIGVAIVLLTHPDISLKTSDWASVLYLFLISLFYISAFITLSIFISACTKHPRTSLVILLIIWVILVLSIPNLSPWIALKLHPVRSVHEVEMSLANINDEVFQKYGKDIRNFMQSHDLNKKDSWSEADKQRWESIYAEYTHNVLKEREFRRGQIRQEFINEIQAQATVSRWFSMISPSSAFTSLASDLAHTGVESERDFRRACIRYRMNYTDYLVEEIKASGNLKKLSRIDEKDAPYFTYREIDVEYAIQAHLTNFIMLLFYTAFFFFAAQIILIRSEL
jgi:ABC-2 type transport system permease protein